MENEILLINHIEMGAILEEMEDDQHNRHIFEKKDPFVILNNKLFKQNFRLTKPVVRMLLEILDPFLQAPTRRSALTKQTKVLVALHFFSTGSYQLDIGYNIFSGVSQPSVSRCIKKVAEALNRPEVFNRFVNFPNSIEELNTVRHSFFEKYGFPGVVGVIDGTHVAIIAPNANDPEHPEHIYVNRKGYHSINTQLICDSNMKILNVNARFPGSANDIYIWNHSIVKDVMENLTRQRPNDFYILGDSGYILRLWMQIPIPNFEPGSPEERYNTAFKRTRSIIEQCIGLLKMRFRCLLKHRVLHYTPTKASKIINACVVLHNVCIEQNILEPEDIQIDLEMFNQGNHIERVVGVNRDLIAGRMLQQQIVNNFFAN